MHLEDNELRTDLQSKPTDSHKYLLFTSSHLNKYKERIAYSQCLVVIQICSKLSDLDKHLENMTLHFLDIGYLTNFLQDAAIKARRINRHSLLHPTPGTQPKNTEHFGNYLLP